MRLALRAGIGSPAGGHGSWVKGQGGWDDEARLSADGADGADGADFF